MVKSLMKVLCLVFAVFIVSGCASSQKTAKVQEKGGKLTTRAYMADKERVDQDMEGNFGFLYGTPVPDNRDGYKKTRKIYVLEVTKEPGEVVDVEAAPAEEVSEPVSSYERPAPRPRNDLVLPSFRAGEAGMDEESAPAGEESGEGLGGGSYTIQKNDTLQKISKKHYGSYSKWMKIYEANKDVIPDPNRIKPGVVIQIP